MTHSTHKAWLNSPFVLIIQTAGEASIMLKQETFKDSLKPGHLWAVFCPLFQSIVLLLRYFWTPPFRFSRYNWLQWISNLMSVPPLLVNLASRRDDPSKIGVRSSDRQNEVLAKNYCPLSRILLDSRLREIQECAVLSNWHITWAAAAVYIRIDPPWPLSMSGRSCVA